LGALLIIRLDAGAIGAASFGGAAIVGGIIGGIVGMLQVLPKLPSPRTYCWK
jgi:hypothetical protein